MKGADNGPRPDRLDGAARDALAALPVSEAVKAGLQRYFCEGIPTGGFLRACLENDLLRAVERADLENRRLLPEVLGWLKDHPPASAWGSPSRVSAWLEAGALGRPGTFEVDVRVRLEVRGDDGEAARAEAQNVVLHRLRADRYVVAMLGADVRPAGGAR